HIIVEISTRGGMHLCAQDDGGVAAKYYVTAMFFRAHKCIPPRVSAKENGIQKLGPAVPKRARMHSTCENVRRSFKNAGNPVTVSPSLFSELQLLAAAAAAAPGHRRACPGNCPNRQLRRHATALNPFGRRIWCLSRERGQRDRWRASSLFLSDLDGAAVRGLGNREERRFG